MPSLDLTLSPETLAEVGREVEREMELQNTRLHAGNQIHLKLESKSELKRNLEKYIDFESGGLKLLDVPIRGGVGRFTLVPDLGKRSITLQFNYRF